MDFKNRIIGAGTVDPKSLNANVLNWRKHPQIQKNAMQDVLENIGWIQDVIVNKNTGNLIDGHLRVETAIINNESSIPVKYVDLSENEEKLALATFDPISAMAEQDSEILSKLIESTETDIDLKNIRDFAYDNSRNAGLNSNNEVFITDNEEDNYSEKDESIIYFTPEEIQQAVLDEWENFSTLEDMVKQLMSPAKAMYEFNRLCQGYNSGYNISLLFNPHRLDTATKRSKWSIYKAWNDFDSFRSNASKLLSNNKVDVSPQNVKLITLGCGGVAYVNEFQPYVARDIYKANCEEGFKILDPCSGWGGRMIGLASCMFKDIEYVSTDPSVRTYNGLLKLKEFLRLGDNFKLNNKPFEDFDLEENYFDFCFTSPPYFDIEKYADEETQSYIRYGNGYDSWKNGFLIPMLDNIYNSMKSGGYACLIWVIKPII